MSGPKWTPGPWEVKKAGSCTEIWADRGQVASIDLFPRGSIQADSDAHLIAAAPDLYAALEDLLSAYEEDAPQGGYVSTSKSARKVLAKARGEA